MSNNRQLVGLSVLSAAVGVFVSLWLRNRSRPNEGPGKSDQLNGEEEECVVLEEEASAGEGDPPLVKYDIFVNCLNLSNPQLVVVLQYVAEKSAFIKDQLLLEESGGIKRIAELLCSTDRSDVKILCYKAFTNIATNPAMLQHVKPIIPFLYDELLQEDEVCLPFLLTLLVNVTSHGDLIMCSYNLRTVPNILSRYTPRINYNYDIVLSTLKILINMTCADMDFNLSMVYMPSIHLLHGCKNNVVLLRVLTLLRNILTSQRHESTFDKDLIQGVAGVISCNEDEECLELARQIYQILTY